MLYLLLKCLALSPRAMDHSHWHTHSTTDMQWRVNPIMADMLFFNWLIIFKCVLSWITLTTIMKQISMTLQTVAELEFSTWCGQGCFRRSIDHDRKCVCNPNLASKEHEWILWLLVRGRSDNSLHPEFFNVADSVVQKGYFTRIL